MGFLEISAVAAVVFNVALAVLVVRTDFKSLLHRAYIGWALSLGTWNLASCFMYNRNISLHDATFWGRVLMLGVIYMPVCLLHVCLILTNSRRSRAIPALYALHTLFALTLPSDLFVARVRLTPHGYWTYGGLVFYLFLTSYFVTTVWLVLAVNRKRRTAPPDLKPGLTALLAGVFVLWICGSNDLLPILGQDSYPLLDVPFFPLGNIAANFYAVLVAYSVFQHELLDVHVTMSKAAARLVRLCFVFGIALVLLLIAWMLDSQFNAPSLLISLVVVMVSTTAASILFPRLFGQGADMIERRILGDRFEYQDKIRSYINLVQESGDADQLLKGLDDLLIKVLRVSAYQLVMVDETSRKFTVLRQYPENDAPYIPIIGADAPMLTFFRLTGAEQIALNLPSDNRYSEEVEDAARASLAEAKAEFCFPFMVGNEPFGLLFLRERAEGKRYTATDIHLLAMLARNLSLALNQIRLKNQILQAQESELLGRMSRGMAHDMNNLVTPVQTLIQLIAEGISVDDLREELLPLAARSIDTLREYIREALFFSENSRADFKLGRLDMVLAEAVEIVSKRCAQKGITLTFPQPPEALVEMDKSLIKRTVSNILGNAIDASATGTEIRAELLRLDKTEPEREWYRLRIIDQGEGISPENIERIFTPYFTTKNRGDEQRGFGLGLSICRKVVQIHGGSLKITSQQKVGTTVFIDLPDHQLRNRETSLESVT